MPTKEQSLVMLGNTTLAESMVDVISEIPGYRVTAFAENLDPERCQRSLAGLPTLWVDELAKLTETHQAVCGLATTHRRRYVEQVAALGMHFATLAHPSAWISTKAVLGEGCFVNVMANVAAQTVLGKHVMLNRGALIGHHARIGDYVTVQPGANIAGLTEIGERTFIGMGALVLDRVKIGSGCVVGAGAVVTKDLPDGVLAVGVPAKVVRTDVEGK